MKTRPKPGELVRYTRAFRRSTGFPQGPMTVRECSCRECAGAYLAVDWPGSGPGHVKLDSVELVASAR